MSTAQSIINRAFRLATGSTDTPGGSDTTTALEALNNLLGSWQNDGLVVFSRTTLTLPTVAAQASYTIGPSGDLVTTRPVSIEKAYIRESNSDYEIELIEFKEWDLIVDKTATSDLVTVAYYNPTSTNGTFYVWPIPDGVKNIYLDVKTPFSTLAAGDTLVYPPGYERALGFALAIEIAPEYGQQVPAVIYDLAAKSKAEIMRTNSRPIKAKSGLTDLLGTSRGQSNILVGP